MPCTSGWLLRDPSLERGRPRRRQIGTETAGRPPQRDQGTAENKQELRPVETVIEEALHVLAKESRRLLTLPLEPLRDLVNRLITEATVDMETKAVDPKSTLPAWALFPKPKKKNTKQEEEQENALEGTDALCPASRLRSPASCWTHPGTAIDLGSATRPPAMGIVFSSRRIRSAA
jgi:hypothetical protein